MDILILEDDKERTKSFLALMPFAKCVPTAKEAIDHLQKENYQLLMLDHDLGGSVFVDSSINNCGMAVVRWIEEHPISPNTKIVIHSMNIPAAECMASRLANVGYQIFQIPYCSLNRNIINELTNNL